jgi:hydrogenase maturation factor
MRRLNVGKLPAESLAALLEKYRMDDPRLIVGPRLGEDAAAIDFAGRVLVAKTDPITFTTDRIGWYAVNVNANDIAVMGARPQWFLASVLLPEKGSDLALADSIFADITAACRAIGAVCCGGHIEVTAGLDRPMVIGQMLGEVPIDGLRAKAAIRPGMAVLLAKPIGIEATSILARERAKQVTDTFGADFTARAQEFLFDPGISVVRPALAAAAVKGTVAMHDPTEGGIATGLHELAAAGNVGLQVDVPAIPIREETARLCMLFGLHSLGIISSGSLLIVAVEEAADEVARAVRFTGAECVAIGHTTDRRAKVLDQNGKTLPRFDSDEISRVL